MYNPWLDATMLAMEASGVIYLRTMKLALGGQNAQDESQLMVTEKMVATAGAVMTILSGGSVERVIADYRTVIDANAARLLT